MNAFQRLIGQLVALSLMLASPAGPLSAQTFRYQGGGVWTGEGFEPRDLLIRDGVFVDVGIADRSVDLAGGFVVPAYANAHAHITNADQKSSDYFLDNGVFYVWNPGSVVMDPTSRSYFARKDTYDVKFAFGAITEPGGHPEKLYVDIIGPYVYPGKTRDWFLDNAFNYGRTDQEVNAALSLLAAQNADFIKVILVNSEEYEKRREDPSFYGLKGLNSQRAKHLVGEAARLNKPVAFHVESVEDLLIAADAGAFMAAHLPGYGYKRPGLDLSNVTLSEDDAVRVAKSGMILVPTYSVAKVSYLSDPAPNLRSVSLHYASQASNLRALDIAGANFAIGTDQEGGIFTEVEHLAALGVFNNRKLLSIVFGTGSLLFPERRIGCFEPGCEADFLVLRSNPMDDAANLRTISMRVKAGTSLRISAPSGKSSSD